MSENHEKFLSRWSRLKQSTPVTPPAPAAASAAPEQIASEPPQLPPVEELTFDSRFSDFMHPKVEQVLKRAALKKLFSDPHFNVMDGLDTYIDDYSKGEELPATMLAQMQSAQKILRWARNEVDEGGVEEAGQSAAVEVTATEQIDAAPTDESPALDPLFTRQSDDQPVQASVADQQVASGENS